MPAVASSTGIDYAQDECITVAVPGGLTLNGSNTYRSVRSSGKARQSRTSSDDANVEKQFLALVQNWQGYATTQQQASWAVRWSSVLRYMSLTTHHSTFLHGDECTRRPDWTIAVPHFMYSWHTKILCPGMRKERRLIW